MLIIRDPVALWLIWKAVQRNLLPANSYLAGILLITIIATVTAILAGHGNVMVAVYGARIFLIHFPIMFVIGRILTREDVLQIGRITLILSIPMLLLIAVQFYSPQSGWINRGVGGDITGGGFSGSLGYFRPPATFSFITGTTQFFSFTAIFVFYFWVSGKKIPRFILISSTICLLAAVPLSISRSLFFQMALTGVFAISTLLKNQSMQVG